jgi:Beta-propeller repeat
VIRLASNRLTRCIVLVASTLLFSTVCLGQSRTYSTSADFNSGVLFNVNSNTPDQLELNAAQNIVPLPFLWIANAGEDTESKFDTTQFTDGGGVSRPGKEIARYRTWFNVGTHGAFSGPAPSRTAVDGDGNVYVANRHFDGRPASVMKILFTGGIDRNNNGIIDTSTDTNNNGVIDPAEIIPLVDNNPANGLLDQAELADERVAWLVQVGPNGGLGRSLSIAPDGSIWVGLFSSRLYYKLSPTDGSILAGPISVGNNTPYGSVVDGTGRLWGASISNNLLELNTNTNAVTAVHIRPSMTDYGIALGNDGTGLRVYQASFSGSRTFSKFAPGPNTFTFPAAISINCYGISTDPAGNVYVSGSTFGSTFGCTKFSPAGTIIWSSTAQAGATGGDQRGAIIDANGDVWVVNLPNNRISKYRGSDGAPLGTLPTGLSPYTYSDASGQQFLGLTTQTGNWSVVFDSGRAGATWGSVNWNSQEPTGTAIVVQVRADNVQANLPSRTFSSNLTNGGSFCGSQSGRFIEVKATFTRAPGVVNPPILYDLSVGTCPLTVSGLIARAKPGKVNLVWPQTAGSGSYLVFRKLPSDSQFTQIGTSLTGVYLDNTVINGVTYQYTVQSVVNQIASANSNIASVLIPTPL